MPTNAIVVLTPGTLPEGFCHQSWQLTYNEFIKRTTGYLPSSYSTFNYGNTIPDAADRDKPWIRLNGNGSMDRVYVYFSGSWKSPHAMPAGVMMLYGGTVASMDTLDGGAIGAVGDATGPFWEELTAARARSPLHPGTLASGLVVAAGDTGGEEKHTMTTAELVAHTHDYEKRTTAGSLEASSGGGHGTGQTGSTGSSTPFNVMHPYYGVYIIRRTARLYYSI